MMTMPITFCRQIWFYSTCVTLLTSSYFWRSTWCQAIIAKFLYQEAFFFLNRPWFGFIFHNFESAWNEILLKIASNREPTPGDFRKCYLAIHSKYIDLNIERYSLSRAIWRMPHVTNHRKFASLVACSHHSAEIPEPIESISIAKALEILHGICGTMECMMLLEPDLKR